MLDQSSLERAVQGCAAVAHLAAAKADGRKVKISRRRSAPLGQACVLAGCRRLINISTQSTKIPRMGTYARTKRAADEIFHSSGLDVTSLLPSIVYSETKGGVFGTILQFVQKAPVVVVLGNGKWRSAPVYVGDVSSAVIACLETPLTIGKAYDIGGPEAVRFDD
jgi:NADH dehydrogenase